MEISADARTTLDKCFLSYIFWSMVVKRFNEGIPSEGADGMEFADVSSKCCGSGSFCVYE
jgi:hypothetical protein